MCTNERYNEFPSRSIGGPPGLYRLRVPVSSKQSTQFLTTFVSNGGTNVATILISGSDEPPSIDVSGSTTYGIVGNAVVDSFIRAQIYQVGLNNTIPGSADLWEEVTNPQGIVFIRIIGATFATVSIKYRVKLLAAVPAPAVTVPPDMPDLMNEEREKRINQAVYGSIGEEYVYGKKPLVRGSVLDLQRNRGKKNE